MDRNHQIGSIAMQKPVRKVKLISKKGSTLHDFPYRSPDRKCPHFWIINVTPPGPAHCVHICIYCYARQAIYSDYSAGLPHCERFRLPFSRKQTDGHFRAIDGCTANCHVTCREMSSPPCQQPELVSAHPFKLSNLRERAAPGNRLPGMI